MQGMSMDVIKGPVGRLIGLVVWLVVMPLMLGAINGWYLQSVDAGVIDSERFDRVVVKGINTVDAAWAAVTTVISSGSATELATTSAHTLEDSSGNCHVQGLATSGVTAATAYTPLGSEVSVTADGAVSGCKWSKEGAVFNAGGLGGLVEIILQASGLAPPIAVLLVLGSFGAAFMRNMGGHPIMAAMVTVIVLLLVATLVNSLMPFLTSAFTAVDGNRYVMYDQGLGNVSVIVKRFYGVVLVSGLIMVAWSVVQNMRGGSNALGGQKM